MNLDLEDLVRGHLHNCGQGHSVELAKKIAEAVMDEAIFTASGCPGGGSLQEFDRGIRKGYSLAAERLKKLKEEILNERK